MTIWRMRIAYWIPKATNRHSECVILIAIPLQRYMHERAPVLCYTHVHYVSSFRNRLLRHAAKLFRTWYLRQH
jgi:hypothetical protein